MTQSPNAADTPTQTALAPMPSTRRPTPSANSAPISVATRLIVPMSDRRSAKSFSSGSAIAPKPIVRPGSVVTIAAEAHTVPQIRQIYYEVGKHLYRIAAFPNLYQRWIDTYRDEAFGEAVRQVLAHTDDAFAGSAEATRMLMRESYLKAVRYEWMFWDSAYRMEAWPI